MLDNAYDGDAGDLRPGSQDRRLLAAHDERGSAHDVRFDADAVLLFTHDLGFAAQRGFPASHLV